jgi:uncharacterized repeat protein (TIGR01451 family)
VPAAATLTATDNCDPNPLVTFAEVKTAGSCPQSYTLLRTWTAKDGCGNTSSKSQTLTVIDNTVPVLSAAPADATVQCNAVPAAATLTATDNCDPNPLVTFAEVKTAGSCPQSYTLLRTWTATDACGNHSTASQTINVVDTKAPSISCPTDQNLGCNPSEIPVCDSSKVVATDNCGDAPTITCVFVDSAADGVHTRTITYTATDACNNSTNCVQKITWTTDSTPPMFTKCPKDLDLSCNPSQIPTCDLSQVEASAGCDVPPTVSCASTDAASGCTHTRTLTYTATDLSGRTATCVQKITWTEDTTAPSISALPAATTIECPATPSFATPTATDACDASPTLTFSDVTTPGSCPQNYSVTRTWAATDACGNSSTASQTIHVVDTTPPSITCPANISVQCSAGVPAAAKTIAEFIALGGTASDNCDKELSVTSTDGPQIGGPCQYTIKRTYTVTDHCNRSASCDQTITVVGTPHLTITKVATDTSYSKVGDVIHYTITATNDGNTTLAAVTITDANAVLGTFTPANGSSLAPGAAMTGTATHAVTQADIDAGHYANTACVDDGPGGAAQACATKNVPASQLGLTKTDNLNPAKYDHVGQVVTYTLTATNYGNVTLHNVTVVDAPALDGFGCVPASGFDLAPGATISCTGTHTITQADLDAGHFTDAGTADCNETVPENARDTIYANQNPHLTLSKSANPTSYSAVGDVITYTLVATNDGNVTLHDVSISDPMLGALTCTQPVTLAPGASLTCTGSHMITQGDLDAGKYDNTATANGTGPAGQPVSATASATVTSAAQPCSTPSSIQSSFNGTSISTNNYIWFNANFSASGIPSTGATISFKNSKVAITSAKGNFTYPVPNGKIVFNPSATCATTTFDGTQWVTTVPVSGSDEILLSALGIKAPADLKAASVTWSGDFSADKSGISVSWKWGAAVYTTDMTKYTTLGVKPTHANTCAYSGSDHAGTPMSVKKSVIGGARGGGGSNYTGSWSGTGKVTPCPTTAPAGAASVSTLSLQHRTGRRDGRPGHVHLSTDRATSSATTSSTSGTSTTEASICPVGPGDGNLRTLTMTYEGRNASSAGGIVTGNPNGLDAAYLVVTGGSPTKTLFSGAVSFNSKLDPASAYFVIDAGRGGALPGQVTVTIYTARGGASVSTVSFDASCAQPLHVGDYFGSLRVSGGSQ